MQGMDDII